MYDFFKLHHNCDAYMGVHKEQKSTFLTAINIRKKKLTACLLHNIDIAVVSECLCHRPKAQYSVQSLDICIGQQILHFDHPVSIMRSLRTVTVTVLVGLNVIQTISLQIKIGIDH